MARTDDLSSGIFLFGLIALAIFVLGAGLLFWWQYRWKPRLLIVGVAWVAFAIGYYFLLAFIAA